MNNIRFDMRSEYIARVDQAIDQKLASSLTKSVSMTGDLVNNLVEEDLKVLADIHSTIFRQYNAQVMPEVTINDERNAYSLELDALHETEYTSQQIELGGAGKSKRFCATLFILGEEGAKAEFTFPSQKCTFICNQKDALIIPPYFSHNFLFKSITSSKITTLNMYNCMQL